MTASRLVFRVHALRRMVLRNISDSDVRTVLTTGEIIEEAPRRKDLSLRHARGEVLEDVVHRDAQASDARLAAAPAGLDGEEVPVIHGPTQYFGRTEGSALGRCRPSPAED